MSIDWTDLWKGFAYFLESLWKGFVGSPSNAERGERSEPSEAPTGRHLHAQTNHWVQVKSQMYSRRLCKHRQPYLFKFTWEKKKQTKHSNTTQTNIAVYICPPALNTFVTLHALSGSSVHANVCPWVPHSARFARLARRWPFCFNFWLYFNWKLIGFWPGPHQTILLQFLIRF